MGYCPKCGARIKRKRKSTGRRECRRHGPIEKNMSLRDEMMNRATEGKYRLVGREIVPCKTLGEWVAVVEDFKQKIVIQEYIYPRFWPFFGRRKKSWVSTVFLAIDHRFMGDGPPILFESMVFDGPMAGDMNRCCTYAQAVEMHHQMCMDVEDELWGPLPR